MDYCDYDYSEYDYLDEFTIRETAYGFSRTAKEKIQRSSKQNIITEAIKRAIVNGKLISTLQITDDMRAKPNEINWNVGEVRIQRRELEKWFESRNDKPPFLFPDARNQNVGRKSWDTQKEQLDPRERTTLLQIIAVLAAEADLPLTSPFKAAEILQKMGAQHSLELAAKKDTIASKLKAAFDLKETR